VATIPPLAGLILERVALATGFLAAAIAVGGFLARALDLLGPNSESDLQRSAAIGGVCGFAFGLVIILLDAFLS
jgi:hypothetical protein